jgi:hypothetical protein
MIQIMEIFDFVPSTKSKFYVSGKSNWRSNIKLCVGDTLTDGQRFWTVAEVSIIFEGCFGEPEFRSHYFGCDPLDMPDSVHNSAPDVGSIIHIVKANF